MKRTFTQEEAQKFYDAILHIDDMLGTREWDADLFEDVSAVVTVTIDETQTPEAGDDSPAAEGIRAARAETLCGCGAAGSYHYRLKIVICGACASGEGRRRSTFDAAEDGRR